MTAVCTEREEKKDTSLSKSTRVVLIMEYDGTRYYGSQVQANLPTIQGEVEAALHKLTGEKSRVMATSRTDTGVHARGQVVSFRTGSSLPLQTFIKGINYYLPKDITVKDAFRASDSFNVRRSAIMREYSYYILNRPTRSPMQCKSSYQVASHLDTKAMNQACQALVGSHDFASFVTSLAGVKSTIRHIYKAKVTKDGDLVVFNVVANAFLPHQIRNTIGSLIKVGLGKITVDEFYNIVAAKRPGLAGPTAPARGLCLMQVSYPHPFRGDN